MDGAALKGTIGCGGLGVLAVWVERAEPVIGFWPLACVVMVPFIAFLFVRRGELSDRTVDVVHTATIFWYLAMLGASAVHIGLRGPTPQDAFFAFFMALGLWPCVSAARGLLRR
ncbi:MAG: hypothetical protein AAF909_04530 [Pseudomonadota bacterium]